MGLLLSHSLSRWAKKIRSSCWGGQAFIWHTICLSWGRREEVKHFWGVGCSALPRIANRSSQQFKTTVYVNRQTTLSPALRINTQRLIRSWFLGGNVDTWLDSPLNKQTSRQLKSSFHSLLASSNNLGVTTKSKTFFLVLTFLPIPSPSLQLLYSHWTFRACDFVFLSLSLGYSCLW